MALLPTPVADHSRGLPSDGTDYQSLPNALVALLPTPAVNDMGAAYTPEEWDAWTAEMKAKHGNGNGHGKSLNVEAQRLLPTPNASDAKQGFVTQEQHEARASAKKASNPNLGDLHQDLAYIAQTQLLPTPRATDGTKGGPNQRGSSGDLMLPSAVSALVQVDDGDGVGSDCVGDGVGVRRPCAGHEFDSGVHESSSNDGLNFGGGLAGLPRGNDGEGVHVATISAGADGVKQPAVKVADWGEYEPAIRRWESVTRPAPAPTKLNSKGNPKLSDEFDEWLMGYPEGWITDVPGVTWNETLKACGNGVVPQQGAAAVRWLVQMGQVAA